MWLSVILNLTYSPLFVAITYSKYYSKLRDLGVLCGLMPGGNPTSEQLHIVVGLSAGMGDNPGLDGTPSPTDRLKEALCSKDAFNKNYLVSCTPMERNTSCFRFFFLVGISRIGTGNVQTHRKVTFRPSRGY